jgi:hypothetical protein
MARAREHLLADIGELHLRRGRRNNSTPNSCSRDFMAWDTADCEIPRRWAGEGEAAQFGDQ